MIGELRRGKYHEKRMTSINNIDEIEEIIYQYFPITHEIPYEIFI